MTAPRTPAHLSDDSLTKLLVWFSPAFPVGAFVYSQGLEAAVEAEWVSDAASLEGWLTTSLAHGPLWSDLVVAANTIQAEGAAELAEIAEMSLALQTSAERRTEALILGQTFREAYLGAWKAGDETAFDSNSAPLTYAVAVGLAARDHRLPVEPVLDAFAMSGETNLISAAIRLGVIGQVDGQRLLAGLRDTTQLHVKRAAGAGLEDITTVALQAELASIKHETQTTRLFRS